MEEEKIANTESLEEKVVENSESLEEKVVENTESLEEKVVENSEEIKKDKLNKKKSKKPFLLIILLIVILSLAICLYYVVKPSKKEEETKVKTNKTEYKSEYRMKGNSIENFDLYFLKLENEKNNKIYSPLSIKYALGMIAEGAEGDAKEQITSIIGDYEIKKYPNSKNMSFANAMFIRDTYKDNINKEFIDTLSNKYNAEIKFDSFTSPDTINNWVKEKTLGLIGKLFDEAPASSFEIINALGIDMNWEETFFMDRDADNPYHAGYTNEDFRINSSSMIEPKKFDNLKDEIAGMEFAASINNYDIINDLGENNIRKTVGDEFKKFLLDPENVSNAEYYLNNDFSSENIEKVIKAYIDEYIKEIGKNYKVTNKSTGFSLYVDDNIKAFGKDLKEYDGITLEYVAIMPQNESLDSYINNLDSDKLSNVVNNLKELKPENFKEGVITEIDGFIPRFKFDYKLNLKQDLESLGIKDIFNFKKANLTKMSSEEKLFIENTTHKAVIELTQDGIKAAAVTEGGGRGAGGGFYYLFDVPVEKIDLTFDKPYMFIIMDKNTNEVWFIGTVYEPLKWTKDLTCSLYCY